MSNIKRSNDIVTTTLPIISEKTLTLDTRKIKTTINWLTVKKCDKCHIFLSF